jgi:hypothetical protein
MFAGLLGARLPVGSVPVAVFKSLLTFRSSTSFVPPRLLRPPPYQPTSLGDAIWTGPSCRTFEALHRYLFNV